MRKLALLATLASLAACGAGGADGASRPTARLLSERIAFVGTAWEARIRTTGSSARPTLVIGGRRVPLRRSEGAWTALVTLSRPGRVTLSVRLGARTLRLGAVTVGFRVTEPFRIEAEPGGTLLVADGRANAILRLDPRTGVATRVASLPRPISVARGGDGALYAIADEKLWRLDAGAPRVVADLAGHGPLDVAPMDDGSAIVATYGERLLRVAADGGVSTYATGLARPHGIAIAPEGALYAADTYSGTLKLVERDGSVRIVARGFATPSDVLVERGGSVLVVEHDGGQLARVDAAGRKTTVARGLGGPASVTAGPDGTVWVALLDHGFAVGRLAGGRLVRVSR